MPDAFDGATVLATADLSSKGAAMKTLPLQYYQRWAQLRAEVCILPGNAPCNQAEARIDLHSSSLLPYKWKRTCRSCMAANLYIMQPVSLLCSRLFSRVKALKFLSEIASAHCAFWPGAGG